MANTQHLMAVVAVFPHKIGIPQKTPFVFEISVSGKDIQTKFEFLKSKLGQEVRAQDVFKIGQNIDVHGITRGKGVEGPVTRFGIKRKQHKSRKSVRAVGTLGSNITSSGYVYCCKTRSKGISPKNRIQ